jgi:type II secretory pathway predicted ATPase ExeA
MYNSFFGFSESPFENKLDQKFIYLSEDHKEVLAAFLYFMARDKGFAVLCGDVGTGKTMMINSLLNMLSNNVKTIIISNPNVMYSDLLHYIAKILQLSVIRNNLLELLDDIKQALVDNRKNGKIFVIIIDEAHLLSDSSLENIRLLSNIQTQDHQLLKILLVGQYELSRNLDRTEMRQLRQRINISRFLSPLNKAETFEYIDHRLKKVGASYVQCFEANCLSLIYKMSEGVPRKINQLCDNALLICMTDGLKKVDRKTLKKAGEALITDLIFTPKSSSRANFRLVDKLSGAFIAARTGMATIGICLSLFLIAFILSLSGLMGESVQQALYEYFPGYRSVPSDPAFWGLTKDQGKTTIQVHETERPSTGKEVWTESQSYAVTSSIQEGERTPGPPQTPRTENKDQPEDLLLKEVLINMKKAHEEKDISKFMGCFARTFPQRYEKRQNTLMIWKSYDLLNMIFTINDVKQIDSNSYMASVTWIYQTRNRYSKKIEPYTQQYEIRFINEEGQWGIKSLNKKSSNP